MKTALFLMVPNQSHYYPTFGLAKLLQTRGYLVVYGGKTHNRKVVEKELFSFRLISYVEDILISTPKVAIGLWFKSRLDPSYNKDRYRRFLLQMQNIETLIREVKPDVVFLDYTLSHYYACLANKVVVIQISTRLSPYKRFSQPPPNAFNIPKNNLLSFFISNFQWWYHLRHRWFDELLQKIIFNNLSQIDFLKRYEKRKGIVWKNISEKKVAFCDAISGVPMLILSPKSLEYENTANMTNEYYLYLPYTRVEDNLASTRYSNYIEKINLHKQSGNSKLIYVSLGTLSLTHANQAKHLLHNITLALGGDETVNVLISSGGINLKVERVPSNVVVFTFVPQLDVLKYCDLFITHGGLGSIKESISCGVPILVFPLNKDVDQPGNSARIVSIGLGLRGEINDSPAKIRNKVYEILYTPHYKTACRNMQLRLAINGQEPEAILKQIGI